MMILFFGILLAVVFISIHIVLFFVSAFLNHIIMLDSIIFSIVSGVLCHTLLGLHAAFALFVGIAVFVLMFWLHHTKYGFWVIGILMSVVWGFILGLIVYLFTEDYIWLGVIWGLVTILTIGLHLKARNDDQLR